MRSRLPRRYWPPEGRGPPARPADLLGLRLLQSAERQDWALWFQAQGVEDITEAALGGISFDDQTLLLRAAASDQGVALVTETLARPELERGGLVRVLDVAWPQEFAYWLVCPRASADQARAGPSSCLAVGGKTGGRPGRCPGPTGA